MNEIARKYEPSVIQSHHISRAAYIMPAATRRLLFAAMHFAQPVSPQDPNSPLTAEMTPQEIIDALGLSAGGSQYQQIKEAFDFAMKQILDINTEKGWTMFHWLEKAQYNSEIDVYFVSFSHELTQYINEVKKQFSILPLSAIGKLQGKYSMRIYELVMSMSGMDGKEGNKRGSWFYQIELSELRSLFKVGNQYSRTGNFRTRVIDQPVEEINKSEIGIHITPEYIYRKRTLYAVKFKVRRVSPKEPRAINPVTETGRENMALRDAHPEKWEELFKSEMDQKELFEVDPETKEQMAEERAIRKLKEWARKNK